MSFIDSVVGLPVEFCFKTPFNETIGGFYSAMERHSGKFNFQSYKLKLRVFLLFWIQI